MKRRVIDVALAGICLWAGPAIAGPSPGHDSKRSHAPAPPGVVDAMMLSNNISGDGRLVVSPDAYGAYQNGYGATGNGDSFDPFGPEPALTPMFASAFFVFGPATLDRAALAESTSSFPTNYPSTYTLAVTSPQVGSDFDGDGVIDTSTRSFTITGGNAGVNLSATLVQRVYKAPPGTSIPCFRQTWVFTNNDASPADLKVMKHVDMDIFATPVGLASWADVAGSIDAPGCQPITVYEREPSPAPPTTPISFALLSTTPQ